MRTSAESSILFVESHVRAVVDWLVGLVSLVVLALIATLWKKLQIPKRNQRDTPAGDRQHDESGRAGAGWQVRSCFTVSRTELQNVIGVRSAST